MIVFTAFSLTSFFVNDILVLYGVDTMLINSVGVYSPTDNKKDAHGFGKEICLITRDRIRQCF